MVRCKNEQETQTEGSLPQNGEQRERGERFLSSLLVITPLPLQWSPSFSFHWTDWLWLTLIDSDKSDKKMLFFFPRLLFTSTGGLFLPSKEKLWREESTIVLRSAFKLLPILQLRSGVSPFSPSHLVRIRNPTKPFSRYRNDFPSFVTRVAQLFSLCIFPTEKQRGEIRRLVFTPEEIAKLHWKLKSLLLRKVGKRKQRNWIIL